MSIRYIPGLPDNAAVTEGVPTISGRRIWANNRVLNTSGDTTRSATWGQDGGIGLNTEITAGRYKARHVLKRGRRNYATGTRSTGIVYQTRTAVA